MRKQLVIIWIALLILCGCQMQPKDHAAEIQVIRLATDLPAESMGYQQLENFAQKLEEASGQTMKVKLYPRDQWGADQTLAQYTKSGRLEMSCVSTAVLAEQLPEYTLYSYPGLFRTAQDLAQYVQSGQESLALNLLRKEELCGVGFVANGFLYFQQTSAPAVGASSWSGMTFYGQNRQITAAVLNRLGISFQDEESYRYGENHLVDQAYLRKLIALKSINESSFLNDPDLLYDLEVCFADQHWWESLSNEQKDTIRDCFHAALSEECTRQAQAKLQELVPDGGISCNGLSAETKEQLRAMVWPMTVEYIQSSQNLLGNYFSPLPTNEDQTAEAIE